MSRLLRSFALPVLFASLTATPALAQQWQQSTMPTGWYGSLSGAALQPRDTDGNVNGVDSTLEFDTGFGLYGAGGYRFGSGLRLEGELGYGLVGLDGFRYGGLSGNADGDVELWSATAGAYYDFATGTMLTPYVGAGAGAVHQSFDSVTLSSGPVSATTSGDSDTNFTAFGEAGVSIRLSPQLDLVPSYRYQWIADGESGFDDTEMHVFKAGLRYWF